MSTNIPGGGYSGVTRRGEFRRAAHEIERHHLVPQPGIITTTRGTMVRAPADISEGLPDPPLVAIARISAASIPTATWTNEIETRPDLLTIQNGAGTDDEILVVQACLIQCHLSVEVANNNETAGGGAWIDDWESGAAVTVPASQCSWRWDLTPYGTSTGVNFDFMATREVAYWAAAGTKLRVAQYAPYSTPSVAAYLTVEIKKMGTA